MNVSAILIALIGAFAMSACTSKVQSSSVSFSIPITVPSAQTASGGGSTGASPAALPVQFVLVNISGSDFTTIFDKRDFATAQVSPAVTYTVPRGSARLIQVIAGAQDSDGNTVLYYGDTQVDVASDTVNASLTVSLLTTTKGDARIAGRYLRATGVGPTGALDILFHPDGKPTMLVGRTPILAGWFDVFALFDGTFDYVVEETGETLFAGVNAKAISYASSFAYAIEPQRNALISIPDSYRTNWSQPSVPSAREHDVQRSLIMGYFGATLGTLGKSLCYNGSAESVPNVFLDNSSTTNLQWDPTSSGTTTARVTANGQASGAACVATNDFDKGLHFLDGQLANRDKLLGFQGPFRLKSYADGTYSTVNYDSSTALLSFDWTFLPGIVDQGALDGVTVYYRGNHSPSDRTGIEADDGNSCNNLPADFINGGNFPVALTSASVPVSVADWSAKSVQILVCPYREKLLSARKYIDAGMIVDLNPVTNYATNFVLVAPTQHYDASLHMPINDTSSPLPAATPSAFQVYAVTSDGRVADGTNGTIAYSEARVVTTSDPAVMFPTYQSTWALSFTAGHSSVYLQPPLSYATAGTTRSLGLTFTSASSVLPALPLSIQSSALTFADPNAAISVRLANGGLYFNGSLTTDIFYMPTTTTTPVAPNNAIWFSLQALSSGGNSATTYNEAVTLMITTPGVYFYSSGSQTSSASFSGGYFGFYLKFDQALAGTTVPVNITLNGSSLTNPMAVPLQVPISVTAPAILAMYGSASTAIGYCQPYLEDYEDINGAARPQLGPISVFYGFNGAAAGQFGLSGDASCGNTTSTLTSTGGLLSRIHYFRFTAPSASAYLSSGTDIYSNGHSNNIVVTSNTASSASQVKVYGQSTPTVNVCTPYMVAEQDANGISVGNGVDHAIRIGFVSTVNGAFFSDTACTVAVTDSSVVITNASRATTFYYKAADTTPIHIKAEDTGAGLSSDVNFAVAPHP